MNKKKIKVKVKKKKINFKKLILFLLILYILYFFISSILNYKITNIYIINNNIVSDNEIIKLSKLDNYPSFILSFKKNIKSNILTHEYIKDVKVEKKLLGRIYITISEEKILYLNKSTNKLVLENGASVDNIYNITSVPILLNEVSNDIYDDMIKSFSKIDNKILLKISEIEYVPLEVDKERFLFYMNDSNYVYINLKKIESINKYEEIKNNLENKKGIIYLDSGNYFEVKE